ncbi:MAG: hypothetical protein RXO25_06250, partial [Caldivirga sp.]
HLLSFVNLVLGLTSACASSASSSLMSLSVNPTRVSGMRVCMVKELKPEVSSADGAGGGI